MTVTNSNRPIRALTLAGLGVIAAIVAGCGKSDGASPLFQASPSEPKPANSVYREPSPQPSSQALAAQLSTFRNQAFGSGSYSVAHDDVSYTAAFRHAIYLNSVNSAGNNTASGLPPTGSTNIITGNSAWFSLQAETLAPTQGAQWPALYTNESLSARLESVVGGRDFMRSALFGGAAIPSEVYIFDGDIYRTDGSIGELRGYAERDGSAVENIWYARRGRVPAMRAALRSFGFGHKSYTSVQNGAFAPPFPILNNRFIGVAVLLAAQPAIAARSVWPNDGNEDVRPYGLDTDLSGPNQYSGPPIHVTLPVDEPFLRNTGVTQLNLTKVASNGGAPIATTVVPGGNQFRVYSNVSGLVVPSIAGVGQYAPIGPIAPSLTNVRVTAISGLFTSGTPPAQPATSPLVFLLQGVDITSFTVGDRVTIKVERRADPNDADVVTGTLTSLLITGVDATSQSITVAIPTTVINAALITWGPSLQPFIKGTNILTYKTEQNVIIDHFKTGVTNISADVDNKLDLRNGELVIVPVSPLEPLTWYRLQYSMGTASYQTGAQTIHFKTNARGK